MMPTTKKLQILSPAWTMYYMDSWDNWKFVPTNCLLVFVWIIGISTKPTELFTFHRTFPYDKKETKYLLVQNCIHKPSAIIFNILNFSFEI